MVFNYNIFPLIFILIYQNALAKINKPYAIPLHNEPLIEKAIAISLIKAAAKQHEQRKRASFIQTRSKSSLRSKALLPLSNQVVRRKRISTVSSNICLAFWMALKVFCHLFSILARSVRKSCHNFGLFAISETTTIIYLQSISYKIIQLALLWIRDWGKPHVNISYDVWYW